MTKYRLQHPATGLDTIVDLTLVEDPPPPPPVELPTVTLSADATELSEDHPSVTVTATLSKAAEDDVTVTLGTLFQMNFGAESIVIRSGSLSGSTLLSVTEFPESDTALVVSVSTIHGATFDPERTLELLVKAKVPPPPPLRVSLWADVTRLRIGEAAGEIDLVVSMSRVLDKDIQITLLRTGDATADVDYTCPDSVLIPAGKQTGYVKLVSIPDKLDEPDERIIVAIEHSDEYETELGSVEIIIVDDDEPEPEPKPDPEPGEYKIKAAHPRLYWHSDIAFRLLHAPVLLAEVVRIANTDAATRLVDTPLCCATLWMLWKDTQSRVWGTMLPEQYRDRAILKLLELCKTPINVAGNHYALNHLHPIAVLYDWLHPDMTEDQRVIVRGVITQSLKDATARRQDLLEDGYNVNSGLGMTPAIAIHGETDIDWVAIYYRDWLASQKTGTGGRFNRAFERMLNSPGNHEDQLYFGNQVSIRALQHAWETATGDLKFFDTPWLTQAQILLLHQCHVTPKTNAAGAVTGGSLYMTPSLGGVCGGVVPSHAYWLAAGTGSKDESIAAMSAWMLARCTRSIGQAFEELFWLCIVGDPRVKPKSPEELGLPLDLVTMGTGFYHDRTDWTREALRVSFCCSPWLYRCTGTGDVMIWAGGLPLIGHRCMTYHHAYCGYGRLTLPQILDSNGVLMEPLGGGDVPRWDRVADFRREGEWFVGDISKLYPQVQRYTRRFRFDRTARTVEVVDECVPKPGYRPVATWCTPLAPKFGLLADGITFTNGVASGLMTFDALPGEVKVCGGETDDLWAQDYDGSFYEPAGAANWRKLPIPQQILAGGYYTVYVTPQIGSDGIYRLGTKVSLL